MESNSTEDTATKHILDYYKKYSQNKELPKYFSGTSLSYLPVIKDAHSPEVDVKTLTKTDIKIIITTDEVNEVAENMDEAIGTSRGSSPLSNHKLEWDNGADIGYDNCIEKRLRRSLSLPTIANTSRKTFDTDVDPVTSRTTVTRSQSSSSDGNVKVVLMAYSSDSESQSDENQKELQQFERKGSSSSSTSTSNVNIVVLPSSLSSSSDSSDKQNLKQFASILTYLKKKIGVPDAHSTPKCTIGQDNTNKSSGVHDLPKSIKDRDDIPHRCSDTEIVSHFTKDQSSTKRKSTTSQSLERLPTTSKNISKKLTGKHVVHEFAGTDTSKHGSLYEKNDFTRDYHENNSMKYHKPKVINLAVTKPITVECMYNTQQLEKKSSKVVKEKSSVAVQTDEIAERKPPRVIHNTTAISNNQSLIYFEYSDSDKSDKTSACSTQTGSNVGESNCNSFEYLNEKPFLIKGNVPQNLENSAEVPKIELMFKNQKYTTNLKNSQKTSDCTCPSGTNSTGSNELNLQNVVSSMPINSGEDDIGKNIYILQRLLKSKKYDRATKRKYIKRIIRKITESKYLEDSTTSSELFIPKKAPKADSSGDRGDNPLQSNNLWQPIVFEQIKLTPRKKFVQKTFTQNFLPSSKDEMSSIPEIVPINTRDTRKNPFTLTNNEFSVNQVHKTPKKFSEADGASLEKQYESSSTSKSYENWKDDKTVSEKIFEHKSVKGNGDYFIKFADKEREFQLSWINNEISHLGKLKSLLQKPENIQKAPINVKKTTNVYTVFNENEKKKPKRNYVIETVIGAQSSSAMNFNLDGQVYTVQSSKNKRSKSSKQVTGNIEVISSDSTTNIKISTFCEKCRRSPCNCDSLDDCICYREGTKCNSDTCICKIESNASIVSSSSSSKNFDDCFCCICKKFPCICKDLYKESKPASALNFKDSVLGMFVPASSEKSVKFSTFPSTSKDSRRNFISLSQEVAAAGTTALVTGSLSVANEATQKNQDTVKTCGSNNCICQPEFPKVSSVPIDAFASCSSSKSYKTTADSKGDLCGTFIPVSCYGRTINFLSRDDKRNFGTSSQRIDVVDKTTVIAPSKKDHVTTCGSLRKVFENCACTQTSCCTCDFVEKLVDRFSQPGIPCSTICDYKCLQTEKYENRTETQSVDLQTSPKTRDEKQQTVTYAEDNKQQTSIMPQEGKSLQTERGLGNIGNIGIQHQIDTKTKDLQTTVQDVNNTGAQTKMSIFSDDFKDNKVQTEMDVKHQWMQAENKDEQLSPTTQSELQDVATSVPNFKNQQDASTSPGVHFDSKSIDNSAKQKDATTSYDKSRMQKDSSTSPSKHFSSNATTSPVFLSETTEVGTGMSLDSVKVHQEAATASPALQTIDASTSSALDGIRKQQDASTSPKKYNEQMKHQESATVPKEQTIGTTTSWVHQEAATTSPTLQTASTSSALDGIRKQQDASTSPKKYNERMKHQESATSPKEQTVGSTTSPSLEFAHKPPDKVAKPDEAPASKKVKSVATDKKEDAAASQTVATQPSEVSQPASSKSSSSDSQKKKKVICVCCCTQTESLEKQKGRNVKIQAERDRKHSDRESSGKGNGDSSTSCSTTFEICPSILVSSGNDISQSIGEEASSKSSLICFCCNEKYPSDKVSMLGSKNENYPLCCYCLANRPILTSVCYAGPEDNCPCSKPSRYHAGVPDGSDDVNFMMVTDSNTPEEYCTCTRPFQARRTHYCDHCQYKLRNTTRNKNGIAYTLTLETGNTDRGKRKRKKNTLQEIKVKVPSPSRKKKHKDKENVSKRDGDRDKLEKCACGRTICTRNCHAHGISHKRGKEKKKTSLTLQEHLKKNRPHFIESAEYRRNAVLNSKNEREDGLSDAKIKFVEENLAQNPKKEPRKLFTEQEMKEITRRNYKKLPEVQKKLDNKREQRLRNADRFIADVFTRKIRHSVLKGRKDFPIDINVVSLPKT